MAKANGKLPTLHAITVAIEEFTDEEFSTLLEVCNEEHDRRAKMRVESVRTQINELVASHNLSPEEIENLLPRSARGKGGRANKAKSPAKFRNPDDNDQVWTGRGKRPGWFVDNLAKGIAQDDMLIPGMG